MKTNQIRLRMTGKRFWQGAGRSQGMLEFALAAPILLMLLFAIVDFSLLFSAWLLIQNISRQAVRYAVTGDFNPVYCTVTANGPCQSVLTNTVAAQAETSQMEDAARLPSIHDVANSYRSGLLLDASANQLEPGYINVTICSDRVSIAPPSTDFRTLPGVTGSTVEYADCQLRSTNAHQEDAGGPGDTVSVTVDFNHPFITPFLQLLTIFGGPDRPSWLMTHLASTQTGVVETFRTSRMMNYHGNPDTGDTETPSKTPTATNTSTASDTFTPTATDTATDTATATFTPSMTPTPDCALFSLDDFVITYNISGGRYTPVLNIDLSNASGQDTWISNLSFEWAQYKAVATNANQAITSIRFNNVTLNGITNAANSPTGWSTVSSDYPLVSGASVPFVFTYLRRDTNYPIPVAGSAFGLSVTLGNGCTVEKSPLAATATPTPTQTRTPTKTFTPTQTYTPSKTFTPTNTFTPSNTPTKTLTPTITLTPSKTFTPSRTFTPTNTYTATRTFTPTNTYTATKTFTPTFTATQTNTATMTLTPSKTNTATFTSTPTNTLPPTNTPTRTRVPTNTNTPLPSNTPTKTPTKTNTPTPAPPTATHTVAPTFTPTVHPTNTNTPIPTFCLSCNGFIPSGKEMVISDQNVVIWNDMFVWNDTVIWT